MPAHEVRTPPHLDPAELEKVQTAISELDQSFEGLSGAVEKLVERATLTDQTVVDAYAALGDVGVRLKALEGMADTFKALGDIGARLRSLEAAVFPNPAPVGE